MCLEKLIVAQLFKKFSISVYPEGLLACTEESATGCLANQMNPFSLIMQYTAESPK